MGERGGAGIRWDRKRRNIGVADETGEENERERERDVGEQHGEKGRRARDAVGVDAGGLRVESAKERGQHRERGEEEEQEAVAVASERRRCQCARGRRVGLGVGVTSSRRTVCYRVVTSVNVLIIRARARARATSSGSERRESDVDAGRRDVTVPTTTAFAVQWRFWFRPAVSGRFSLPLSQRNVYVSPRDNSTVNVTSG